MHEYRSLGGYPLGAEYDSRAPWNEPEDDSRYELDMKDSQLRIKRIYNQTAEDEWETDQAWIDPDAFDHFVGEKLGIAGEKIETMIEEGVYIIIVNWNESGNEKFEFETSLGNFNATMEELIDISEGF